MPIDQWFSPLRTLSSISGIIEGPSAMMIWYAGWFIALVAEESKYKSLSH